MEEPAEMAAASEIPLIATGTEELALDPNPNRP